MAAKTMLSSQDAVEFVRDKLGIKDIEGAGTSLEMLSKIQRHLLSELPFQNISLLSSPPEKRFPTLEDVISDGLSLRGGACIHNNWFTHLLLKTLGYDTSPVGATYCADKELVDGHMVIVVRGLVDPEDPKCEEPLFLVDAASGFPLPAPVPLHRLPITYPETAGLKIRVERFGDYVYRLQQDNDPHPNEKHPMMDGWKAIVKFTLTPADPPSLRKGMEIIFCSDPPRPFMRSSRIFRWPQGRDWAVGMRDNELMFYGKDCPEPECHLNVKIRKHKMFVKDNDLKETIMKYFPMLCQKQLEMFMCQIYECKKTKTE